MPDVRSIILLPAEAQTMLILARDELLADTLADGAGSMFVGSVEI